MLLNRYTKLVTVIGVAWLMQACQMTFDISQDDPVDQSSVDQGNTDATDTNRVDAEAEVFIASENPYLKSKKRLTSDDRLLWESAVVAMKAGNLAAAEKDFLALTNNDSSLSGPLLNLAIIYASKKDPATALDYSEQAIRANTLNGDAYNYRAFLLREEGRFEEAEKVYKHALSIWKDNPDSHRNLGILYDLYLGKLSLALTHYQYYQKLLPEPDRQVKGWIIDIDRRLKQQNSQ